MFYFNYSFLSSLKLVCWVFLIMLDGKVKHCYDIFVLGFLTCLSGVVTVKDVYWQPTMVA